MCKKLEEEVNVVIDGDYGIRYPKTRRFSSPKPNGSQRFRTNHGSKIGTFFGFLIFNNILFISKY